MQAMPQLMTHDLKMNSDINRTY